MVDLERDIGTATGDYEWLVTNGLGSYASGTVAGSAGATRRYHGLLIAALQPPVSRTLLLTKLNETVIDAGRPYPLFADRWADSRVEPADLRHLARFRLEGTTPVWTYAWAGVQLEKRIWMQTGANVTYIRYDLRRASGPLALHIEALVNYRNHHGHTVAGAEPALRVEPAVGGLRVSTPDDAPPFYLLSDR
ncbi:MAG: glycogen debranching enzyme N-terminal domain-containing protein, partial [Chloroflexi bacterium]|nr:glycogen debranching enzyme N-terminal domain-containing protein [Chloroflexota bacterium]